MDRSYKHSLGYAGHIGYHVEQVVDPVTEIDIGVPAWPIHGFIAGCAPAAIRMRCPVLHARVCFSFRDHARGMCSTDPCMQHFAKQPAGQVYHIMMQIESSLKLCHPLPFSGIPFHL